MTTHSRNLGKFYLVLAIFIVPMLGSGLLYFFNQHFHLKTMNHGELITPPIQATFLTTQSSTHLWQIIHIDNGQCDQACEHINYQLNQVRKVLGKDQDRLIVTALHGNSQAAQQLQTAFEKQFPTKMVITEKIYLLDPIGNIFMYYPENAKPMDVLKDLKRVLEVSQIG